MSNIGLIETLFASQFYSSHVLKSLNESGLQCVSMIPWYDKVIEVAMG